MNEQSDELFKSCSFCVIEKRKKDLYKCSNCGQTYCSLRCYRSKRHSKCSEKFYEEQCRDAAGEKVEFITLTIIL